MRNGNEREGNRMKKKNTGYDIMEQFLLTKIDKEFTQLEIQIEAGNFQRKFDRYFLPESLSRYFRYVRDDKRMKKYNCEILEVPGRKHMTFTIKELGKPQIEIKF